MKNDSDSLKQSNASTDGASNGALGGATSADLTKGYTSETKPTTDNGMGLVYDPYMPHGGFAGRPEGWER